MSAPEARMDRVLGAGPFCEIGRPRVAKTSPDGTLIVVGGALVWPQWHGHDVSRRSRPNPGWYPVAVYRSDDFTCLYHFTARWPANAISFHPNLPLVAIGTGSYDGGWAYEGELLLLDLTTGTFVSLMAHRREVRRITWRDPETLDLVLAVPCDEDEERFGTTSLACSIRRDDWDRATDGMLRMPYGEEPVPEEPQTDPAPPESAVSRALDDEVAVRLALRQALLALPPKQRAVIVLPVRRGGARLVANKNPGREPVHEDERAGEYEQLQLTTLDGWRQGPFGQSCSDGASGSANSGSNQTHGGGWIPAGLSVPAQSEQPKWTLAARVRTIYRPT